MLKIKGLICHSWRFFVFTFTKESVYKPLIATGFKGFISTLLVLVITFLTTHAPYESEKYKLQFEIQKKALLDLTPNRALTIDEAQTIGKQHPELIEQTAQYIQKQGYFERIINMVLNFLIIGTIGSIALLLLGLAGWDSDMKQQFKTQNQPKPFNTKKR